MKRRFLEWLPAIVWMGFIFALSSQSSLPGPADHVADFALKKSLHVVAYGLLVVLLLLPVREHRHPYITAFVIAALYAASDELHQSLVPFREGTLRDIAIDSFAAAATLLLVRWQLVSILALIGPLQRLVVNRTRRPYP